MARTGWFRVPLLVLSLALVALPALAGKRPGRSSWETGFWHASARAVVRVLPSTSIFEAVLSALGVLPAQSEEEPEGGSTPDLGPGFDPMG